ncbi:MAG: hypothetical protein ABR549_14070 [Mycobacteriales bacterium]
MAEFDINKVKGNDRFIAGGAVVIFILSFLPWYTVSYKGSLGSFGGFGTSGSVNAWDAYGWNKLAIILALVAGGIVVARLMGALDSVQLPVGVNLVTLGVSGLASAIFLLRLIGAYHSAGAGAVKVSAHPGFGWYLAIVVSCAMTYFAFLNVRASGEVLPSMPGGGQPPVTPDTPPTT